MMTLRRLLAEHDSIPTAAAWAIADLAEHRGRQELFTHQAPQRLETLREHAIVESAVSSNRIEGIEVEPRRLEAALFGRSKPRDRNEEELRGYREALSRIHEGAESLPVSESTLLDFHRCVRRGSWDAGRYKEKDGEIVEKMPDGSARIRYLPLPARATPGAMVELVSLWNDGLRERKVPPLVLLAAFNLDFLCIHPFRDGNGRVSRLAMLLQCLHLGFAVGRYVSLERLIEENRERYYETLAESSRGWREGTHDPWPYVNFTLFILKSAYAEFEARLARIGLARGAKAGVVEGVVDGFTRPFTFAELERACRGVSRETIRRVLRDLKAAGRVSCLGRGPGALWANRGHGHKRGS